MSSKDLFLCFLKVVSVEALVFLFAYVASFGNMDNDSTIKDFYSTLHPGAFLFTGEGQD